MLEMTPPVAVVVPLKEAVDASKDAIWKRMVAYIAQRGAQPQMMDKESGLISVRSVVKINAKNYSQAGATCPKAPTYIVERVNVLVSEASSTSSEVSVTMAVDEVTTPGWFDYRVQTLACKSTGIVEARLLRVAKGETP